MRIDRALHVVFEQAGVAEIVVILVALMTSVVVCLLLFRRPFMYGMALMVCLATNISGFEAVGMLGRYPLVAFLAAVAILDRRPFQMTRGNWLFVGCLFLYVIHFPRAVSLADEFVRIVFYTCAFFGYLIQTQKLCQNSSQFRKAIYWMAGVSFLLVWVQVPDIGRIGFGHQTGIFATTGYLRLGMMVAITLLLYVVVAGDMKRLWMIAGIATLLPATAMLLLSGGRTMVLAVLFAIPYLLRMRPGRGLIMVVVATGLCLLIFPFFLWNLEGSGAISRLTSLDSSGRLERWAWMWSQIKESPIIGYGLDQDAAAMQWKLGHNAYLQIAYNCGIPTAAFILFCLSAAVVTSWRQIGRLPVGPYRQMAALGGALLMLVFILTFFEMDLLSLNLSLMLLCMGLGMQSAVTLFIAGRQLPQNIYYSGRPGYGLAYDASSLGKHGL